MTTEMWLTPAEVPVAIRMIARDLGYRGFCALLGADTANSNIGHIVDFLSESCARILIVALTSNLSLALGDYALEVICLGDQPADKVLGEIRSRADSFDAFVIVAGMSDRRHWYPTKQLALLAKDIGKLGRELAKPVILSAPEPIDGVDLRPRNRRQLEQAFHNLLNEDLTWVLATRRN